MKFLEKKHKSDKILTCKDIQGKFNCESEIGPRTITDKAGNKIKLRRCRWKIPIGPCEDLPYDRQEQATLLQTTTEWNK